jgi:hypothetical protein
LPKWIIHLYGGENFCGISRDVYRKVNIFVDDPEHHDINRVIVNGRWNPEAFLYLAFTSYKAWGCEGLKAVVHHNIMDYVDTILSSNKYRSLVKNCEPSHIAIRLTRLCDKILNNIEEDFVKLLSVIKRAAGLNDVVREVKIVWNKIRRPQILLAFLRNERARILDFLESVIKVARELRDCIDECVEELVWLRYWRSWMNHCPVCMFIMRFSEPHLLIPAEYVGEDLAYKIHKECFERLRAKAEKLLKKEISEKEALRELSKEENIPPSVAFEILKMVQQ